MNLNELTQARVDALEAKLTELRDELSLAVTAAATSAQPVELDQPIGRLSRMDALQQQQMASASRRSLSTRLTLVTAALGRIARDEYGTCEECEEPIGYRRLEARPESRLCLACQSSREKH